MIGKKNIKTVVLVVLLSMLLQFVMAFFRVTLGLAASSAIGFFIYYFSYEIIARKIQNLYIGIFISLILGILIIQLPIRITSFDSTALTLLEVLLQLLGVTCGWLVTKYLMGKTKLLAIGAALFLVVPFSFYGNRLWFNKQTYGSFTGAVHYPNVDIAGIDENGIGFSTKAHHGKTIMLDFWHTRCAACFKKFPKLEQLSERYRNDTSILILAINYPLKSDTPNQAYDLIRGNGYTFKTIILQGADMIENIGLKYFPTTYIINEKGDAIFSGDIENAETTFARLVGLGN